MINPAFIICPFCHKNMESYDLGCSEFSYRCKTSDCIIMNGMRGEHKYSLNYNNLLEKFSHVDIIVEFENIPYKLGLYFDETPYVIVIFKLETLLQKHGYSTDERVLRIEYDVEFDFNSPIESGIKIVNRFLNLLIFT